MRSAGSRGPGLPAGAPGAADLIARLGMQPIDGEGGWWAPGPRTAGLSSITVLLSNTPDGFSALHLLDIDEGWQWLGGADITMLALRPDGTGERVRLASNAAQLVIPAGTWQGAATGGAWSLAACWCAPAFTPDCFTLGDRARLCEDFPAYADHITMLTRVRDIPQGAR
ncbi:MAG: cupin domain-containing protein [Nostocoides sp.]